MTLRTDLLLAVLTGLALVGDIACALAHVPLPGVLDTVVLVGVSALGGAQIPRAINPPADPRHKAPEQTPGVSSGTA